MKRIRSWFGKNWKEMIIDLFIFGFAALIIVAAGVLVWISTLEIPDLSAFEERRVLQSTKIYDRTGEVLLYDLHQDVRRTIIPFEEMSRHIKNATVAIEDDQFYNHIGIDFRAIIRAAVSNFTAGDLLGGQGGSTITQQVIKNSVLDRDKKLSRKVKEAILSIKLEQVMEKEDILEIYLNESPYGGTIYGIEEASRAFFGKGASELTLAEASYLAAIPQAPTFYSPYGNNRDALDARHLLVLDRMRLNGFITIEEYDEAKTEVVEFQPQAVTGIRAPHFVMYIVEQLAEKYGEEAMAEQGFRVITTLDWELQKEAERIVAQKAASNTERFNASNAGLVATDPKTGDLLVMVGSRDYFSEDIEGNFNVTLAPRQPGSSIKPFVYANAFRKGYLPSTILFDVATQFSPLCEPWDTSSESPCYAPQNYNHKFVGPISMRNALAQSLNIPAVKTLYLAGLQDTLKFAADMGLTTLNDPDRYGLTLVLGGGEVRLMDMTYAYGVFANGGLRAEPRTILRIEDSRGTVLEEPEVVTNRVLDENVAYMMSDVLSDNVARTPLWGSNSMINFPNRDVAAKSGSTNNLRDAWIMGYAPNIAVGAWCGNNDNAAMGGGLSGLITTPMWRAFMDIALEKLPEETFPQPQINTAGVKPILRGEYIDTALLLEAMQTQNATDDEGPKIDIATVYGNIHSILHFVDKDNPQGGYPANPNNDPQYDNWEYGVQKWNEETFGLLLEAQNVDATEDEEPASEDTTRRRRN
ncbi:MAG: penicillin-binding protein [Candidatus Kaiserbacteria bacterium]|nr:penicillin-binding protein [Candidatus Kaiserbacteria bacterium]MCB9816496.1 penicillin-binding protein [Candidatus Nomurabacteria bacterium]